MITANEGLRRVSSCMKDYRIDCPLTQKQLADRAGVSLRSIQRFEQGEDIQFSTLIKLLNALGLDGNIDMLVPDVSKRPSAYVDDIVKRQRVRISKTAKQLDSFTWGEDQ